METSGNSTSAKDRMASFVLDKSNHSVDSSDKNSLVSHKLKITPENFDRACRPEDFNSAGQFEDLNSPGHPDDPVSINNVTYSKFFDVIPERCVTFCIDTSGSMFSALPLVKEQIMETLLALASREGKQMFNLIEFNSQVTQWADKLVHCTPETVAVASKWLHNLAAKTGTNTLDALLTALTDSTCQAVYLITDDLPDQYSEEVLDTILAVSGTRRIHGVYITGEKTDEMVAEFLEDLAVETFGSFKIVKLSDQGQVQTIVPVYRSEPSHEKLVWTVNDTLRPNLKTCSVPTSLQVDPEDVLKLYSNPLSYYALNPLCLSPLALNPWPDHNYFPYFWSGYCPEKYLSKLPNAVKEPDLGVSTAAGCLLVGKKIIARRLHDGYFYRGTIQSQNFGKSFLVSFEASVHGKFNQVEYEDVYIFDIVDYNDALNHSIMTGDRVLAPWESGGDRFAPGVVIEGQEKRQSEVFSGLEDSDLTVTFSNGSTEKVPRGVAVWIPPTMYDRLALELQMSPPVRKKLFSTVKKYPFKNLLGYPTANYPEDFYKRDPLFFTSASWYRDPSVWWSLYPQYPLPYLYKYPPWIASERADKRGSENVLGPNTTDDGTAVVPNTGMTRRELDNRVMSQIMEHRCSRAESSKVRLDEEDKSRRSQRADSVPNRILNKRERQEENQLDKHVHFETEEEQRKNILEGGRSFEDEDFDEYGNPISRTNSAVNTDSSLLFYSSPGIKDRPRWRKFWHHDPIPPYSAVRDGGRSLRSSSAGTFRETSIQAPFESREGRSPPYDVEWASPIFKYVDHLAKYDRSSSVQECLSETWPDRKENVGPRPHSYTPGSKPFVALSAEEKEELRRQHRRQQVLKREAEWQERLTEEDHMKALMQDHHRERVQDQLERERLRQVKAGMDIQRVRDAKKKISSELREQIEGNQKEEAEKEARRIAALAKRRERREAIIVQQNKEIQETFQRREQIRKQNNEVRINARLEQLEEADVQALQIETQHRSSKLHRIHRFQKMEKEAQKKKDFKIAVTEQNRALQRSQIFA